MKLKCAILGAVGFLTVSAAAQAGPSVSLTFGSGNSCQRPVFYPQQPVCQRPLQPAWCAPVVYVNPVSYGTAVRYSNVSGFVNGGQGVIQVSQPVFVVQPVTVYQGNAFRWR